MKLFKIEKDNDELRKQINIKNYHINLYKTDLTLKDNEITALNQDIQRLKEYLRDKNVRIADVYKELHKLEEENEGYFKTIKQAADENLKLKSEIEYLRSGIKAKITFVAKEEHSNLTRVNGYKPIKEHVCTSECFEEHVLPAIQKDLDSIDPKYRKGKQASVEFLQHWYTRLKKEYEWLDYLYTVDGHIHFKPIF